MISHAERFDQVLIINQFELKSHMCELRVCSTSSVAYDPQMYWRSVLNIHTNRIAGLCRRSTISVVELQWVSQGNSDSGSERLRLPTASLIKFNIITVQACAKDFYENTYTFQQSNNKYCTPLHETHPKKCPTKLRKAKWDTPMGNNLNLKSEPKTYFKIYSRLGRL